MSRPLQSSDDAPLDQRCPQSFHGYTVDDDVLIIRLAKWNEACRFGCTALEFEDRVEVSAYRIEPPGSRLDARTLVLDNHGDGFAWLRLGRGLGTRTVIDTVADAARPETRA